MVTWCGWVAAGLLFGCSVACDSDDRQRDEARRFLALYEQLDHRQPLAQRRAQVTDLAQLPLQAEVVVSARDACVAAHRALIAAEQSHEQAASELERLLAAGGGDDGPLDGVESAKVRTSIEQAEGALSAARSRFEPCESQTRSLSLRFGVR